MPQEYLSYSLHMLLEKALKASAKLRDRNADYLSDSWTQVTKLIKQALREELIQATLELLDINSRKIWVFFLTYLEYEPFSRKTNDKNLIKFNGTESILIILSYFNGSYIYKTGV